MTISLEKQHTLETGLEELSQEAEAIHDDTHFLTNKLLGQNLKRRWVYAQDRKSNGGSLWDLPAIVINSKVASMDHSNLEYFGFALDNIEHDPTPQDFFRLILSHEYGHQSFKELYSECIEQVMRKERCKNKTFYSSRIY